MVLLQTDRDTLLKPLQTVTGIVERRHTLPILSNVLIEGNNGLRLTATDLEIQVQTHSDVQISKQPFSLTVSAKKLQDILRALPDSASISIEEESGKLLLRSSTSRFTLQTLSAEDFPILSLSDDVLTTLKVPQTELSRLISQVSYAMAQQDMRYYLNGLLLVIDAGTLKLIATDGHRLSYASLSLPPESINLPPKISSQEVILPRKTVLELGRLMNGADGEAIIQLSKNQAMTSFDNTAIISKVIDGKFPDYTRVIPVNHPKNICVNRQTLLSAMQRVAILSNEKFRGVRLILNDMCLKVISNNLEQEEAEELINVQYQGEPLDIGFNVTYLLDVLNNLQTDEINLSFGDANSSCLVTAPADEQFKYVVMPMRI
ncbi:MAG: DNA polymerase III subunit beta [Proteobacteria bacterium]|nr:DNA polymerase III subunit beta [Pseudomonadota bacterium]